MVVAGPHHAPGTGRRDDSAAEPARPSPTEGTLVRTSRLRELNNPTSRHHDTRSARRRIHTRPRTPHPSRVTNHHNDSSPPDLLTRPHSFRDADMARPDFCWRVVRCAFSGVDGVVAICALVSDRAAERGCEPCAAAEFGRFVSAGFGVDLCIDRAHRDARCLRITEDECPRPPHGGWCRIGRGVSDAPWSRRLLAARSSM